MAEVTTTLSPLFFFTLVLEFHMAILDEPNVLHKCRIPASVCPNEDITFYLYTQNNVNVPHELRVSEPSTLTNAPFSKGQPVKLLIHGYTGHADYSPNREIRPAYLKKGDYNVISVDYKNIALEPCYITAAYSVNIVGNCTAQLLDELVNKEIIDLEDVHIIGFSLGGQVASQIGQYIQSGVLSRITALDPALPLFITPWVDNKIDPTDAYFVDAIHTNAAWKGKFERVGHVDFYLNGGFSQPGCDHTYEGGSSSCSHVRAVEYFAESISSEKGFWGFQCCNWWILWILGLCEIGEINSPIQMGEYTPMSAYGTYYVITGNRTPFALGINAYPCFVLDATRTLPKNKFQ